MSNSGYYELGAYEKANSLIQSMHSSAKAKLETQLKTKVQKGALASDSQLQMYILQSLVQITNSFNPDLSKQINADFEALYLQMI